MLRYVIRKARRLASARYQRVERAPLRLPDRT